MPTPTRIGITIDCPDPDQLAAFWERFLGYVRRPAAAAGPYVTIDRPDGAEGPTHLTFQRVPEPKVSKARAHLDLFVEHAAPMVVEMIAAGATTLSVTEAGDWTTRVLRDPAGNEFCVIGPD
jgi:hypothetical protein